MYINRSEYFSCQKSHIEGKIPHSEEILQIPIFVKFIKKVEKMHWQGTGV